MISEPWNEGYIIDVLYRVEHPQVSYFCVSLCCHLVQIGASLMKVESYVMKAIRNWFNTMSI